MIPVKMVIFRDVAGDPAMCKATDIHTFIQEDDIPTIEKVFYATTWNEAGQVFNDHEDFGKYNAWFPDIYLSDGEDCPISIDSDTSVP